MRPGAENAEGPVISTGPDLAMGLGVIDGIRTRDPRDHNPVLYLLSYDHHARQLNSLAPHNHSHTDRRRVDRVLCASG